MTNRVAGTASNPVQRVESGLPDVFAFLKTRSRPAWPDRFGEALADWSGVAVTDAINTLSLFTGAGGLDIGFRQAGFRVATAVEQDAACVRTLTENAKPGRVFDSLEVRGEDVRRFRPPGVPRYDFILGCPPCQSFSAAGRRAEGVNGTDEDRGTLFRSYIGLLWSLRPKAFLFENVAGVTGANAGRAWAEMLAAFAGAGYEVAHRVLDAADYGVPQHRERVILVGVRADLRRRFRFPAPTHGPDSPGSKGHYPAGVAVRGVAVSDASLAATVGGRYGHLLPSIPPGLNYAFHTARLGHPRPAFAWRSKFSDFLYKADPDVPVRTLKAHEGGFTGPFHWDSRPFTAGERKRLQTIPDDYELCGNKGEVNAQVGNAVPCQLARILALAVLTQVFDTRLPFRLPLLAPGDRLGFRGRKRLLTGVYHAKAAAARDLGPDAAPEAPWAARVYRATVTPDFGLTEGDERGAFTFRLGGSREHWDLSVSSAGGPPAFSVTLTPLDATPWPAGVGRIDLSGDRLDPLVFASVWRALDAELLRLTGLADLVQLNGFYRNPQAVSCRLAFGSRRRPNYFWRALARVVAGQGVGVTQTARHLGVAWGLPTAEVIDFSQFLRRAGYEVRSRNTNRQIGPGRLLVPYPFPTLMPKSVQRHKAV